MSGSAPDWTERVVSLALRNGVLRQATRSVPEETAIALSYDAPATLAAFARERGITFPLLADEGSVVIRRLGLLNPSYPADHPRHGVAQPATFLLDEAGHVARAIVHASQTVRDVWPTALHEVVRLEAAADAPTARDRAEAVEVSVALDSSRYRPRQRVAVRASPSGTARHESEARSLPAPGSENPWHHISAPDSSRGTNSAASSGGA